MQRDLLEKEEETKRRRKLLNRTNKPMGVIRTTIMDHADDNAWEALMSNSDDSNSSDEDVVLKTGMRARSLIGVAAKVKQSQVSPSVRALFLFPLILLFYMQRN